VVVGWAPDPLPGSPTEGKALDELRERLLRRGDYIWGSWTKPERVDGYIVGVNPGDRADVLGRFPFSEASVDDAVECASKGLAFWRRVGRADRAKALRKFRELLSKSENRFAALLARETGKPFWETKQEVLAAVRSIDVLLEEGLALLEARILNEREARSDYRPRGVVAILVPYNMPLMIPTLQISAALLAGNTVVLKPSKFTPGVGQALVEVLDKCKLPRGTVNLVQGSGSSIGQKLVSHAGIDALLFSGSYTTAVEIRKARSSAPSCRRCSSAAARARRSWSTTLSINRAVYEVLVGAFLTTGQRHNSTGRVIVTEGIFDAFVAKLSKRAAAVTVGYGFDPNTFIGPVISENFRTRYRRYVRALVGKGHQPILEGGNAEVDARKGFYVTPAIYWINWQNGHGFVNEEPPGPTLLVYKVANWEEAVALHNKLMYRVSTSVFVSPEHPYLAEIVGRLKTGSLNLNRGTIGASLRLPAVGLGRSSNGIAGGIDLLRFLSTPRSTLVELRAFDSSQAVPGVNWSSEEDEPISVEVELDGTGG
jgi:acyl-CoA reductase-like NAD-dependent aldehyde dehydrogenase